MGSDKILPKQGQRNILITSALPYVNNVSWVSVLAIEFLVLIIPGATSR